MIFDFDALKFSAKTLSIFFLIFLSIIALSFFANFIKDKDTICDSEKQSKFILECLNSKTIDTMGQISACEKMSIRLYCK